MNSAVLTLILSLTLSPAGTARAEEGVAVPTGAGGAASDFDQPESDVGPGAQGTPAQAVTQVPKPPGSRKSPRKRRYREREAEGTQALGRFRAETVIESHYRLNGRPLEVDPD